MKVSIIGKTNGISKKTGKPYWSVAMVYETGFMKEGMFAETKPIPEELYNQITIGADYEFFVNFAGYIEGCTKISK